MDLKQYIREVHNFPVDGVDFKDITPLLATPHAFNETIDRMVLHMEKVDKIAALESRGFIFGSAIAYKLGIPFIPVRKAGKLPSETISIDYELEYGINTLEIHKDAILEGEKVAIVDDILATGGSAKAAIELIEKLGANVSSTNFLIELSYLQGKDKLTGYNVNSLLEY